MINLPLIELDMTKKDKPVHFEYGAFTGEDKVYVLRLKPVNGTLDYDWTNKVAVIVWSAKGSEEGYPSPEITPVDGVVSMIVTSAWLSATTNQIQLNIYDKTDSEFNEQAPIVEWYVRQSLPITDPAPERVDFIADQIARTTAAVESLSAVETTCTEAAEAAAQSAEDADDDRIAAASALSQTIEAIGSTIAPLGTDGKVPIENIPATAITKNVIITDESQRATIDVEQNDVASLVGTVDGEQTVIKAWQLMGADKTDMANWIVCGTSYAVQAGSAAQATTATNSDKVDGFHFVGMTQAEYDAAVIEPNNTIYVVTP